MIAKSPSSPTEIRISVELPEGLQASKMEIAFTLTDPESPQFFTTELVSADNPPGTRIQPLRPTATPAPKSHSESPTSTTPISGEITAESSLLDAFELLVRPTLLIEAADSTIKSNYVAPLRHFVDWCAQNNPWCTEPGVVCAPEVLAIHERYVSPEGRQIPVSVLDRDPNLLPAWYAHCLGSSVRTANRRLDGMRRISVELLEAGVVQRKPATVKRKQIRKKQRVKKQARHFPKPATADDQARILQACLDLADEIIWPKLGDLEPYLFWWNVFSACSVHGFRPADLWPLASVDGVGLRWSEISLSDVPPIDDGEESLIRWEFGWLNFEMNKTGERLVVPMAPNLRYLIERCQGLHPDRVFPMGYTRKSWYREIDRIKRKAGLYVPSDDKRSAAEKEREPGRNVTLCGGHPDCSYRKAAASTWTRLVSRACASHMLGHSVRSGSADEVFGGSPDESFSDVTEKHYAGMEILREVVAGMDVVCGLSPEV